MKYKIIIADDHDMFLDGLMSIFKNKNDYSVIFTTKQGKNILKYLDINSSESVDLVITDLSMPEMDGVEINKQIKERHPKVKTLVVSMHIDPQIINTLISDDVDGYVPKNSKKEELIEAISTIFKGEKYFSKTIKDAYMKSVFNKEKDNLLSLTEREKEVLKLIAQENTTQEIADILLLSKHTIESYRKTLISKLNVRNLAGLTKYAIKMGLID